MLTRDDAPHARLEAALSRFHPSHRDAVRDACTGGDDAIREGAVDFFADKVIPIAPVVATTLDELPETVIRKCCSYKSCGNTQLLRQMSERFEPAGGGLYRKVVDVTYVRDSNGDTKFGGDLADVLVQLNDPTEFPVFDGGIYDGSVQRWVPEATR